ncbi:MAG TPA: Flp family type IVb pilin [Xanthobacteraceae bacterium]|jgi:pilus assembly protein Flp/PilA|nr:Flp family type IVb pilin [Xanthobacteraceae bacterium]
MFKIKDRERSAGSRSTMSRFLHDERGATAIEYAMIASGVAVAIVASVNGLGTGVKGLFTSVSTALK